MFFALGSAIGDTDPIFHGNVSIDAIAGVLHVESIDAFIIKLIAVRVVARRQSACAVLVSISALQPTMFVSMPTDSNASFVLVTHRLTLFQVRPARVFQIATDPIS
jgi:hypothetical protein